MFAALFLVCSVKFKFLPVLLILVAMLASLAFLRVSSFKVIEQNIIAGLQAALPSTGIRIFQIISDTISFISLGIPLVFVIYGLARKKELFVRQGLYVLLSIALAGIISATIKRTIREPRPYEVDARINQYSVGGSNSFPSGHTAEASAAAIGISLILFRHYLAWVILSGWALLIMASRIALGVHNFTDILAGITVGCIGLLIVAKLFERYNKPVL